MIKVALNLFDRFWRIFLLFKLIFFANEMFEKFIGETRWRIDSKYSNIQSVGRCNVKLEFDNDYLGKNNTTSTILLYHLIHDWIFHLKNSLSVPIQEEVICFGPGIEVCDDCKPVCGCNQIPVLLCRKRRNCTREERGISVLGRMSARYPELWYRRPETHNGSMKFLAINREARSAFGIGNRGKLTLRRDRRA